MLCCVGLAILVAPLATTGIPLGLALAVGGGLSWAAGTVYLKWARIDGDPMGVAGWQLAIGFVVFTACLLIFDGRLDLGAAGPSAWFALIFVGVLGNAVAYAMWFDIVPVVPAATASLGILGIPVIGVLSTVSDPRRSAYPARHHRLRVDLCGVRLRAAVPGGCRLALGLEPLR